MKTCVACNAPIRKTHAGMWGHLTNPGAAHHYARPAHAEEEAMTETTTITLDYEALKRLRAASFAGDFVPSEEVRSVAEELIDDGGPFARLSDHTIAYLIDRRPATTSTKTGVHALAEVKITPKLWRDLAGVDAAIVVRKSAWKALTDHQREALVHHELMHLDVNDKGGLVLRDHDLEEFGATVRAYGQWMPDIEHFAEQLRIFDSAAA